jgi:hypothetical protein
VFSAVSVAEQYNTAAWNAQLLYVALMLCTQSNS